MFVSDTSFYCHPLEVPLSQNKKIPALGIDRESQKLGLALHSLRTSQVPHDSAHL